MKYKTWQFSNLHNRFLLDLYAWTISIWKKPHNWDFYWHGWTWFCVGMFELMYHSQPKREYIKIIVSIGEKEIPVEFKHLWQASLFVRCLNFYVNWREK